MKKKKMNQTWGKSKHDDLFRQKRNPALDAKGVFKFSKAVADVFPDMAKRSIPSYQETTQMVLDLSLMHLKKILSSTFVPAKKARKSLLRKTSKTSSTPSFNIGIADFGCSRGGYALQLHQKIHALLQQSLLKQKNSLSSLKAGKKSAASHKVDIYGIDSSRPMIAAANQAAKEEKKKALTKSAAKTNAASIKTVKPKLSLQFKHADIRQKDVFSFLGKQKKKQPLHIATMLYSLQFLRIPEKKQFLHRLMARLSDDAMVIVAEKTTMPDKDTFSQKANSTSANSTSANSASANSASLSENSLSSEVYAFFAKQHSIFKLQRGYNILEVSQKQHALKHVIHPLSFEETAQIFVSAGFSYPIVFFSWYNFTAFVVFKSDAAKTAASSKATH